LVASFFWDTVYTALICRSQSLTNIMPDYLAAPESRMHKSYISKDKIEIFFWGPSFDIGMYSVVQHVFILAYAYFLFQLGYH